jgi:hypothetical protein
VSCQTWAAAVREKLRPDAATAGPKKLKETVSPKSGSSSKIAQTQQPKFFGTVNGHPHRSLRFSYSLPPLQQMTAGGGARRRT